MKDIDYAQCNIYVRVEEKKLMTDGQLREVLYAGDNRELRHVISKTPYEVYTPESGDIIGGLLAGLDLDEDRVLSWARSIAPEPQVVDIFSLRREYHNLKVLCKEEILGIAALGALLPGGIYAIDALRHAVKTRSSSQLSPQMLEAIQDVMDRSEAHDDIQQVDVVFDRYYFKQIVNIAGELEEASVLGFIQYSIDLFNVSVLLRANKEGFGRTFLQSVLSSSGGVSKETWINMRSRDLRTLTDTLLRGPYREDVQRALDGETGLISVQAFEIIRDNALTEYAKRAKLQPFGPLPLLAYLHARQTEQKNLRIILKARRAGFRRNVAEERLRYSYVV